MEIFPIKIEFSPTSIATKTLSSREPSKEETGTEPKTSSLWDTTGSLMRSKLLASEAEVVLVSHQDSNTVSCQRSAQMEGKYSFLF